MVRWRARNDAQLHYFSRSTPSSTGTSTKEEHPLAASYSEASQSWPVHVRDRLARALWPRARAGCGAWCFVARLDVVVQMLAKAVPDTVERALPEPSPFAHDESTCPPSSKSGHDSSACVCRHDKRGFTTTPRGRLMGAALAGLLLLGVQQWCSKARVPPADCIEWLGCPCGGVDAPARPCAAMYHSQK